MYRMCTIPHKLLVVHLLLAWFSDYCSQRCGPVVFRLKIGTHGRLTADRSSGRIRWSNTRIPKAFLGSWIPRLHICPHRSITRHHLLLCAQVSVLPNVFDGLF